VDREGSEERNPDEDDRSGLADERQEPTESDFIEPPRPDIRLDDVSQIPELIRAGAQYAREHVRREHLYPRSLDPRIRPSSPCR
jgi:predicted acylesterase/phospholipase RssA